MEPVLVATGEKAIDPGESDITMVSLQIVQLGSQQIDGCKENLLLNSVLKVFSDLKPEQR